MAEWEMAQTRPEEQLAQLHFFSIKKQQDGREIEFRIVVREHVLQQDQTMRFFAESELQTNQKTAPFTPCGWGSTLLKALSECIKEIHRFPYEGPLPGATSSITR